MRNDIEEEKFRRNNEFYRKIQITQ